MPWWSWLIIWVGLGLALIAMLVLMGIRLFRKVMRVFAELETLADKMELLDAAGDTIEAASSERAILAKLSDVQGRRRLVRERSMARRRDRRDERLAKARALTAVDASKRRWFADN